MTLPKKEREDLLIWWESLTHKQKLWAVWITRQPIEGIHNDR